MVRIATYLRSTASVHRLQRGPGGDKSRVESFEDVPCHMERERRNRQRDGSAKHSARFFFDPRDIFINPSIAEASGYEIEHDSITYRVGTAEILKDPRDPEGRIHHYEVLCEVSNVA